VLSFLGDPDGSRDHHERGLALSRSFGHVYSTIFLKAELARDRLHAGDWDGALADAEWVLDATRTQPHLMESVARLVRGEIAAARGDFDAALTDLERAVAIGRTSKDPQSLYPPAASVAEVLVDAGRPDDADEVCESLLAHARKERPYALEEWTVALALTLRALGRAADTAALLESDRLHTRWRDAVESVVAGDLLAAVPALQEAGDLPHAAKVRLLAAAELAAAGRSSEADEQRRLALAFYRSVGATRYLEPATSPGTATA
jgi:tetratricopeptide (TPR) repeat protein